MKNLIFDYDGTLHDCVKIYTPAFRYAYTELVNDGLAPKKTFSDAEISQWLGYSAREMWAKFMPELSIEQSQYYGKLIGQKMDKNVADGVAELYPETLSVLTALKNKGYRLIMLSNCQEAYMEKHRTQFGLDAYFDAYYCAETYDFIPKPQIFEQIKSRFDGEFVMIGDRFHDMEVAQVYQIPFVGCLYGFGQAGELDNATYKIHTILDLLELY
ncbi:MAG: HAD family hydrolase [Lactococcus sp.]